MRLTRLSVVAVAVVSLLGMAGPASAQEAGWPEGAFRIQNDGAEDSCIAGEVRAFPPRVVLKPCAEDEPAQEWRFDDGLLWIGRTPAHCIATGSLDPYVAVDREKSNCVVFGEEWVLADDGTVTARAYPGGKCWAAKRSGLVTKVAITRCDPAGDDLSQRWTVVSA